MTLRNELDYDLLTWSTTHRHSAPDSVVERKPVKLY